MQSQPAPQEQKEQSTMAAKLDNKVRQDIYGSFSLNDTEFSISANSIQEVVNELEDYISVPLSPDYLMGLFNLRGMIIPVVDLRKIFNLTETPKRSTQERIIAIIEYGQFSVGLLFDKTGDVFDGNNEDRIQFSHGNEGSHKSVVQGAFKLDDGNRIIQIIDPLEIINLKQLPKSNDSMISNTRKKLGKRNQCISFEVGGSVCALNINAIREILTIEKIDNRVLAGENCLGAINIRGNTVPVIDFGALLGSEPTQIANETSTSHTVIVMKIEEGFFGLLVSSVKNIISYYDEDMIPFPVIGDHKVKLFDGCISEDNSIETILLNHNEVFSDKEIIEIAQGHGELYKEENRGTNSDANTKAVKKTYILFSIDNSYALEIHQVNEVIDYPDEIITPPNLPKDIKGIINLRGTMVAVIDFRALYQIDDSSHADDSKILIFKEDDVKYGLIVDSIDSIVSLSENCSIGIPKCSLNDRDKALSIGAKDIIQMDTGNNTQETLLVMDIPLIISKLNAAADRQTIH